MKKCKLILKDLDGAFGSLGKSIDALDSNKPKKMEIAKGIFGFGTGVIKAMFHTTSCAIEYTPKVITKAAQIKREIANEIESEYREYKKSQKEEELNSQIKLLKKDLK